MSCTNLVVLDVEYDPVGPASYMVDNRSPAMRARCGWNRSGGGTGQIQVQSPEEKFGERRWRDYPVEARDLELARIELEKERFFSESRRGYIPDWWLTPQSEPMIS